MILKALAEQYVDACNFLYMGRGYNFPAALAGALELKEISYIHAEGYPAAEMKHGPIALIDENMPVVFISPCERGVRPTTSKAASYQNQKKTCLTQSQQSQQSLSCATRKLC